MFTIKRNKRQSYLFLRMHIRRIHIRATNECGCDSEFSFIVSQDSGGSASAFCRAFVRERFVSSDNITLCRGQQVGQP
jgi:hypothetical protein